jgi:hypothetical protein
VGEMMPQVLHQRGWRGLIALVKAAENSHPSHRREWAEPSDKGQPETER